jgi:hypothetical protein
LQTVIKGKIPMGRFAHAEEIAKAVAALANGVSGMRTPASDSRRVIVAITELLIACLNFIH